MSTGMPPPLELRKCAAVKTLAIPIGDKVLRDGVTNNVMFVEYFRVIVRNYFSVLIARRRFRHRAAPDRPPQSASV